jgi:hypothetical protein
MRYFDFEKKSELKGIEQFFPDWDVKQGETIVIFSPHDDDAMLGSGYALLGAMESGANVYVMIFHNGNCGYSDVALKDKIVEIRKKETINAYASIGLSPKNIIRLDLPDFSGNNFLGLFFPTEKNKSEALGPFEFILRKLRELKTTRLLFANEYREHIDHTAVADAGIYYGPQVGDPVVVDWGTPSKIKSFMQYAVWGRFSQLADLGIIADVKTEDKIRNAVKKWESQLKIIDGILKVREERKINKDGYVEIYKSIDPRPKMDYTPYKTLLKDVFK